MNQLPKHLRKYIVDQNYEKYTPVDQACWRFILRQLKDYLGTHAHKSYLEGLAKSGIQSESIPRIEEISKNLEAHGWRALPVSGFIPPAAFMELQALGILPIASEMRSLDHLLYTPAPDIVHEAAGHAPILVHPEFAAYLKDYAEVAKKSLISKEDLDLYEAIRDLSDLKENPNSSAKEIAAAEEHLVKTSQKMSHVSEAAELARINWWTSEYGLIGDLESPQIFGAGLLSSVGEARWCLTDSVKKIPLTIDCVRQAYDITEPQPQLFVTPSFQHLQKVLQQLANKMAFRVGGLEGLTKAIKSATVNSVEFNSGVQMSGQLVEAIVGEDNKTPIYLRFTGPCQVAYDSIELPGHDRNYHNQGFGTPVGYLKDRPLDCLCFATDKELKALGLGSAKPCVLEFQSGVRVEGILKKAIQRDGKLILLSFEDCQVTYLGRLLFEKSWGTYDMCVGSQVTSVFGGAADREAFGNTDDFEAVKIPIKTYSEKEKFRFSSYQKIRDLREKNLKGAQLESEVLQVLQNSAEILENEWLLLLEALELVTTRTENKNLAGQIQQKILAVAVLTPGAAGPIQDGLKLVNQL
jgi:phenylalanine-4-hydroxylase